MASLKIEDIDLLIVMRVFVRTFEEDDPYLIMIMLYQQ